MQNILENDREPSLSLLTPIGYQTGDCGYCKKEDQSVSYYATSKSLSVDHYQVLVDRGWRRSGTLFYKPDPRHSCCPHYTIRLPAKEFKPRKDQRQAINRWNRHVLGDDYHRRLAEIQPKSKTEKAQSRSEFDLVKAVHEPELDRLPTPLPEPAHKFGVTLEPDEFTEEKFELFKNYQKHVHHDPPHKITQSGFTRFLCDSPLRTHTSHTADREQRKLGSFHQCYRLDGRLIAMSVLDLLPHCVSGVYFIYHSDFEKFAFGKISALREAALALEAGYEYYYMGYYIHTCKKMRYKNDYRPQYLLDLETMQWNKLDDTVWQLLDENHYLSVSLARAPEPPSLKRKVFESAQKAAAAVDSGTSLFEVEFAGMMTEDELCDSVNLDRMLVKIKKDVIVEAENFVKWNDWSIHDSGEDYSIKGAIAQLVALIGPDIAPEIIVSFGG